MLNETKARRIANNLLAALPVYHPFIPTADIDSILEKAGFRKMEPAIWCGRDGRSNEQVGEKSYLTITWHKMEVTGVYEIVAYVS
jgi:hypothetical protein